MPVVALVERDRLNSARSLRNAGETAGATRRLPDGFAVVALVADSSHATHTVHQFGADIHVTDLTGREQGPHQSSFAVHHRVQFAVGTTAGVADGLKLLASPPAMGILMNLEVACVYESQNTLAVARQNLERPAPDPFPTPQSPPRIDRLPWAENLGQCPSRTTTA